MLDGPDYVTVEWWEETSSFDNHPSVRWAGGIDCYERLYRCRVPKAVADSDTVMDFVDANLEDIVWLED